MSMQDNQPTRLACGCEVRTSRDFLGRVIGTIVTRGGECPRTEHAPGHAIVMPGRDNARPQDR
jgi:translation elongation factor EF-G